MSLEERIAFLESEVERLDSAVRSLASEKIDLQGLLAQKIKEVQALQFALSKRPPVKPECSQAKPVLVRPENKRKNRKEQRQRERVIQGRMIQDPLYERREESVLAPSRFPAPPPGFDPRAVPPWVG